jgi:hypothetical protein
VQPAPKEPVVQFETASSAMTAALLTLDEVHLHYLNSGGFFDLIEIDAYLHGLAPLPREERDCLAQAVNELLDDLTADGLALRPPRATYSAAHGTCVASPTPRPGVRARRMIA